MPQPYLKPIIEVTINRSPILRDDNFKPEGTAYYLQTVKRSAEMGRANQQVAGIRQRLSGRARTRLWFFRSLTLKPPLELARLCPTHSLDAGRRKSPWTLGRLGILPSSQFSRFYQRPA